MKLYSVYGRFRDELWEQHMKDGRNRVVDKDGDMRRIARNVTAEQAKRIANDHFHRTGLFAGIVEAGG